MSGSYPPPGGAEPYGEPDPYDPYGGASGGGWRPPGQPPPPQPHSGWPYGRPDFVPPEQMHYAPQTWGEWHHDPMLGHPGWAPPDEGIQTNAIFALVVSIITLMCCSNVFAIGGITCSIIALTRWQQEPESARNLNKWAWISTAGGLVLAALIGVALLLLPFIPLLGMGV